MDRPARRLEAPGVVSLVYIVSLHSDFSKSQSLRTQTRDWDRLWLLLLLPLVDPMQTSDDGIARPPTPLGMNRLERGCDEAGAVISMTSVPFPSNEIMAREIGDEVVSMPPSPPGETNKPAWTKHVVLEAGGGPIYCAFFCFKPLYAQCESCLCACTNLCCELIMCKVCYCNGCCPERISKTCCCFDPAPPDVKEVIGKHWTDLPPHLSPADKLPFLYPSPPFTSTAVWQSLKSLAARVAAASASATCAASAASAARRRTAASSSAPAASSASAVPSISGPARPLCSDRLQCAVRSRMARSRTSSTRITKSPRSCPLNEDHSWGP